MYKADICFGFDQSIANVANILAGSLLCAILDLYIVGYIFEYTCIVSAFVRCSLYQYSYLSIYRVANGLYISTSK